MVNLLNNSNSTNYENLTTYNDVKGGLKNFNANMNTGGISKAGTAAIGLNANFNTFVGLLMTQLKYQDPTSPLENQELIAQLVAFTGVEQAVATNTNLEKLIELNEGVKFSHASGLIGKEVVYDSSVSDLTQTMNPEFAYSLEPDDMQTIKGTKIQILNSKGVIVQIIDGATAQGVHKFSWDGKDINGKKSPIDTYHIRVNSVDENGKAVKVGSSINSGLVTEAEISSGTVMLKINGIKVPISKVQSFKKASNEQAKETNLSQDSINKLSGIFSNRSKQQITNNENLTD